MIHVKIEYMNLLSKIFLVPDELLINKEGLLFIDKLYQKSINFIIMSQTQNYTYWQKMIPFLKEKQFYNSTKAALSYILRKNTKAKVNYFGTNKIREEIYNYGMTIDISRPDYLLIGRKSFIAEEDVTNVIYNVQMGAKLISLDSRKIQDKDGYLVYGASSLAYMFAYMCDCKIYPFGLDTKSFQKELLSFMHIEPQNVCRICTNLESETSITREFGMTSVFFTKHREINFLNINKEQYADYIVDSLAGIFK